MRAISCAIISLVFAYQGINGNSKYEDTKKLKRFFVVLSWSFLAIAIVLMVLGL